MQAIKILETDNSLIIKKSRMREMLLGVMQLFAPCILISSFLRMNQEEWLVMKRSGPFSDPWNDIFFWTCVSITNLLLILFVIQGIKHLKQAFTDDTFIFDKSRQMVLRNSRALMAFGEIKAIKLSYGDDSHWYKLKLEGQNDKLIEVAVWGNFMGNANGYNQFKNAGEKIAFFTKTKLLEERI